MVFAYQGCRIQACGGVKASLVRVQGLEEATFTQGSMGGLQGVKRPIQ